MYDGNENEIPGTLDGTKELLLIDIFILFHINKDGGSSKTRRTFLFF